MGCRSFILLCFSPVLNVLLLEEALAAVLLQLPDGRQAVHCVTGEPADALGHNQIDLSGQRVRDHLVEAVPMPGRYGTDALVGVDYLLL